MGDISQSILDKTINKLRDRVEMAHLTMNPVADAAPVNYGYQLSNLLYEIRRERRIELVAENHRLDDLKRWNAMKLMENPKTMFGLKITPTVEKEYEAVNVTFGGDKGRPVIEYQERFICISIRQRLLMMPVVNGVMMTVDGYIRCQLMNWC